MTKKNISNFFRTILNEERSNSDSHIHFKDRIFPNDQILLTSKSNTSSATSSLILLSSTDDNVPPKPALPNKNGFTGSRLPS
jgi:hypothetical protein